MFKFYLVERNVVMISYVYSCLCKLPNFAIFPSQITFYTMYFAIHRRNVGSFYWVCGPGRCSFHILTNFEYLCPQISSRHENIWYNNLRYFARNRLSSLNKVRYDQGVIDRRSYLWKTASYVFDQKHIQAVRGKKRPRLWSTHGRI